MHRQSRATSQGLLIGMTYMANRSAPMKTSQLLAALMLLCTYQALADTPPPVASSSAQPTATSPKSQTQAGNALQDEMNQLNKNNRQKQNYRNTQSTMKLQQTNLNKQMEKESIAKNTLTPAVTKVATPQIAGGHGTPKKNGKKLAGSKKPKTN